MRVSMTKTRENFYLPSRELRASTNADGSRNLTGIVAYNTRSQGLPWVETLKPGADVLLLRDHVQGSLLARTTSKTLKLEDSLAGLKFTASLPNTQTASDTLESVSRRDLTGVSFGFQVLDDSWGQDASGNVTRELRKVALHEISVTSFAAFPDSTVSLRSVPQEYRSLIDAALNGLDDDEDDEDNKCECDCPQCQAGDCVDCSNPDCDDPNCNSNWAERSRMQLELAKRRYR
jgi:uncharacterized protein